jgi:hypothetical protein
VSAVNANNPSPPDTLAEMVKRASERKFSFPYLKDEESAVAKAFGAVCTPHAFVVDSEIRVLYSGRIDDSRMGDRITSKDLENRSRTSSRAVLWACPVRTRLDAQSSGRS